MAGYCEQGTEKIMAVSYGGMLLEYNSIICLEVLKKSTAVLSRAKRLPKGKSRPGSKFRNIYRLSGKFIASG
jgi:hypothetical protein